MLQARWMVLQAMIAGPVYFFCTDTLKGQGLAPALVSMGCAFFVTLILVSLLDWFRSRSVRIRHKTRGEAYGLGGIHGSPSDSAQHVHRVGVSQDRRQLPKILP